MYSTGLAALLSPYQNEPGQGAWLEGSTDHQAFFFEEYYAKHRSFFDPASIPHIESDPGL